MMALFSSKDDETILLRIMEPASGFLKWQEQLLEKTRYKVRSRMQPAIAHVEIGHGLRNLNVVNDPRSSTISVLII